MESNPAAATVAIVGAGIVGTCIALALAKQSIDTLMVDRDEPGMGCSFGNSGAISPSSVAPLAMPGILASLPRMLADPLGPLHLPLSYLPRALPWLLQFLANAKPENVARSVKALGELHRGAVQLHQALALECGVPEVILQAGHLYLYPDEAALAKDAASWKLRETHGFDVERLDRTGINKLEPNVSQRYQLGMFLADHATVRNPHRYVQAIHQAARKRGARLMRADVSAMARGGCAWHLETSQGPIVARHVVVAAGARSPGLLQGLGVKLKLESQRGYHVQFKSTTSPISRTVVLADRKVFLTPMEEGVRAGGTVEIAGLERPPTRARSEALVQIASEALEGMPLGAGTHWMGHRPCMPDSVPVIGPVPGHPGVWQATGHGHLGMTDAPATATRIAEGIAAALRV